MAAEREHRKPFFLFRPYFVLFCLYVAAYVWLRTLGDIDVQSVRLPSLRGTDVFRLVGPNPKLPHWRQQLYRAVFSLPMVIEEEARKHEDTLRGLYGQATGAAGMVRQATDFVGENTARDQRMNARPPQFQPPPQQYRQQAGRQPVQYPPLKEGERLIYMPPPDFANQ